MDTNGRRHGDVWERSRIGHQGGQGWQNQEGPESEGREGCEGREDHGGEQC